MDIEEFKYGSCFFSHNLKTSSWYKTRLHVIGCGGTGSRLIPLLAQYAINHNTELANSRNNTLRFKHKLELCLWDFDVV